MKKELLARIEDLADRVLAGEVVFFVGAGFSRDTERNSAERLIGRLLARFYALHRVLTRDGRWLVKDKEARSNVQALHNGLMKTFGLEKHLPPSQTLNEATFRSEEWKTTIRASIMSALAREYYVLNDWMCNAYDEMLEHMLGQGMTGQVKQAIQTELAAADRYFLDVFKGWEEDEGLESVNIDRLGTLRSPARGKALFLDTMGFRQPAVMGGDPDNRQLETVIESYRGRLLPRHHLLARLAREGLCPTLITTNFDLLLEGAYRLSGFQPRRGPASEEAIRLEVAAAGPDDEARPSCFPPTRWPGYERITRAHQYYYRPPRRRRENADENRTAPEGAPLSLGGGQQAATIVKIHGCAETYRHACDGPSEESGTLAEVLSSLVFTFREIQNWRQDSWSRDLLLTLLRTRTMVFCGYSTADPVLHDTFRTIYEEMARRFHGQTFPELHGRQQEDAPAFFLAGADSREFHALEVLRAASQAVGVNRVSLTEHPNYLEFHYRSDRAKRFPQLDEILSWLVHRVYRLRQRQALEAELRSIATLLLPKGEVETGAVKRVITRFDVLCELECRSIRGASLARGSDDDAVRHAATKARHALERVCNWTLHFHPQLLREFALAGLRLRQEMVQPTEMEPLRKTPWYFAAGENFGWTAWGVVVELALRRVAAHLITGKAESWCEIGHWHPPGPWMETFPGAVPTVDLSLHPDAPPPVRLTIRHREMDELVSVTVENDGLPRHRIVWTLTLDRLPWSKADGDAPTPGADNLWAWASDSDENPPDENSGWFKELKRALELESLDDLVAEGKPS